MLIMWSSYKHTFFIHLCMKMKTKHELQLLHSAHKRLSVSHMPVHVIDFPITITKFSITLPITSYVAILNYNYHYHYFSKVIICNRLQLQITVTTSLMYRWCSLFYYFYFSFQYTSLSCTIFIDSIIIEKIINSRKHEFILGLWHFEVEFCRCMMLSSLNNFWQA